MEYHYGKTIREYRMQQGLNLSQLAEKWPSKETGVTSRYVSDIERGVKHIGDISVLRGLATLLQIPLWKLGLSEYNPFQEINDISVLYNLDILEQLIEDTWYIRLAMPTDITEKKIISLSCISDTLIRKDSRILNNKNFLVQYAQVKRLQEIIYTEKHDYHQSMRCACDMWDIAKQSGNTPCQAIALTRIGVELLRDENKDALDYLEKARDVSFDTRSKEVTAYCLAMLARGYVTFGDEKNFLKSIDAAITLGNSMQGMPIATKDYVFHAYSAILEEKSNGLILLGMGKAALHEMPEIDRQIAQESNTSLKMWIPLDYAQSYMLQEEIEASVYHLRRFYDGIKDRKSTRMLSKINEHLDQLKTLGYEDSQVVREFRDMYYETSKG